MVSFSCETSALNDVRETTNQQSLSYIALKASVLPVLSSAGSELSYFYLTLLITVGSWACRWVSTKQAMKNVAYTSLIEVHTT